MLQNQISLLNICSCDIDMTQETGAGGVLTGFAAGVELLTDSTEEAKKTEQRGPSVRLGETLTGGKKRPDFAIRS